MLACVMPPPSRSELVEILTLRKGNLHLTVMLIYRVPHLIVHLGWVDLVSERSTVYLILPGLMGIWQKRLGSWWKTRIKVNPTQFHEQIGHTVQVLRRYNRKLISGNVMILMDHSVFAHAPCVRSTSAPSTLPSSFSTHFYPRPTRQAS